MPFGLKTVLTGHRRSTLQAPSLCERVGDGLRALGPSGLAGEGGGAGHLDARSESPSQARDFALGSEGGRGLSGSGRRRAEGTRQAGSGRFSQADAASPCGPFQNGFHISVRQGHSEAEKKEFDVGLGLRAGSTLRGGCDPEWLCVGPISGDFTAKVDYVTRKTGFLECSKAPAKAPGVKCLVRLGGQGGLPHANVGRQNVHSVAESHLHQPPSPLQAEGGRGAQDLRRLCVWGSGRDSEDRSQGSHLVPRQGRGLAELWGLRAPSLCWCLAVVRSGAPCLLAAAGSAAKHGLGPLPSTERFPEVPNVPNTHMACWSVLAQAGLGGAGAEGKRFKPEAENTEILPEAEEVGRRQQGCGKRLLVVPALGFRGADGGLFITPSDRAEICEVPGLTVGGDPWVLVWGNCLCPPSRLLRVLWTPILPGSAKPLW